MEKEVQLLGERVETDKYLIAGLIQEDRLQDLEHKLVRLDVEGVKVGDQSRAVEPFGRYIDRDPGTDALRRLQRLEARPLVVVGEAEEGGPQRGEDGETVGGVVHGSEDGGEGPHLVASEVLLASHQAEGDALRGKGLFEGVDEGR